MSRLQLDSQVPPAYNPGVLAGIVRALCSQTNALSEGLMSARYYSATVVPSATIAAAVGDIRWDASAQATTASSYAYVRLGWVCTAEGSPGTWKEIRVLNTFGPVVTADIADNAVTDAKLRDSAALSVVGRAANSTGDPADIAATATSAAVLRENGSSLGFGTVATAGIANDAVTNTKIRDSAALSVIGRSANSSGDPADIAGTANQVLRVSGASVLGFGTVDLAQSVTGLLPLANGGLNASLTALVNGVFVSTTTGGSVSTGFSYNGTTVASPTSFAVAANQVVAARITGWGAPTGVLTRTAYSTYPGVTVGTTYADLGTLFTTVQALADHVQILSERVGAVVTDLRTHGLIGT